MPGFSTEVPHTLGKDQCLERLKGFLDQVEERFKGQISEIEGNWDDNVLTYRFVSYGIKIEGAMAVEEDRVKMDGEIPFAAMMFKGKIVDSIRGALEKAVA